jgi:hypothetical protein
MRPAASRLLLVAALAAPLAIAACGGGGSGQSAPSTAAGCPVKIADAHRLLGKSVSPYQPGALQGTAAPVARCMFMAANGSWVQLTEFSGSAMFTQFRALIPAAPAVQGLGASGYCNVTKTGTAGTDSCLFVADGQTYILALHIPEADDTAALHSTFRAFAVDLARRVGSNLPAG